MRDYWNEKADEVWSMIPDEAKKRANEACGGVVPECEDILATLLNKVVHIEPPKRGDHYRVFIGEHYFSRHLTEDGAIRGVLNAKAMLRWFVDEVGVEALRRLSDG